jgi:hypothetical protein
MKLMSVEDATWDPQVVMDTVIGGIRIGPNQIPSKSSHEIKTRSGTQPSDTTRDQVPSLGPVAENEHLRPV